MRYTFCPHCGVRLGSRAVDGRERQVCPSCGFIHYELSKPCVAVLVVRDGKVLLVRRAVEPFLNHWDLPGGFLEAGEAPEDGARREVREETGLLVRAAGLVGILMDVYGPEAQPTLSICYTAEVSGGRERPGSDAAEIGWFALDALPTLIAFASTKEALGLLKRRLSFP